MSGKSVDQMWLVNQGHEVIGVEFSEVAVKATFDKSNLEYTVDKTGKFDIYKAKDFPLIVYRGDFFDLSREMLGDFDIIWDKGGFCILNFDTHVAYVNLIKSVLKKNGQFLLLTTTYDTSVGIAACKSIEVDYVSRLYEKDFTLELVTTIQKNKLPEKWKLEVIDMRVFIIKLK